MEINNPALAYFSVFLAGLVASASPCVLPLIPLAIGYVGGYAEGDIKRSALFSGLFALGLSLTFTILGVLAALTGSILGDIGGFWKYLLAAVAIFMGLNLIGVLKFQFPGINLIKIEQKGSLGALLLGVLFGLVSSPCATPILSLILIYVASSRNLLYGVSLLFVYSLAHTTLIFLLGISTGLAENILRSAKFQALSAYAHKISGIIFVLIGIFLIFYLR